MPAGKSRNLYWKVCRHFCGALVLLAALNTAIHFPYASDRQIAGARDQAAADFYKQAYSAPQAVSKEEQEREEVYVRVAKRAAEIFGVEGIVRKFVADHGLRDKRVLEIGAGRGYLQDAVENYVGLDMSPTAQRYFHKPFVLASAAAMPFKDNEFDAAWTIWVLEHVPNPESALLEMRRVVKPGGYILLAPAWFCASWAAEGYEVRPYSDFGLGGKAIKASIPVRLNPLFRASYILPIRMLRAAGVKAAGGPSRFHYTRLTANYRQYWEPDSDAVNSMDPYEARLWFESRGDRCLNCGSGIRGLLREPWPMVIQIASRK